MTEAAALTAAKALPEESAVRTLPVPAAKDTVSLPSTAEVNPLPRVHVPLLTSLSTAVIAATLADAPDIVTFAPAGQTNEPSSYPS